MRRLFLIVTALMLALAGPAQADPLAGLSKSERADTLRFAVNNSLFTLYHEVGHLLIDRLKLPLLGREEDAADNMATWMLLQKRTPDANQALEDAASGWMISGKIYGDAYDDEDYAAGYTPDRHRSMQIVCLMVGADGPAFRPVANSYSMQADRQRSCHFDYEVLDRSMRALLDNPGTGTQVDVRYHNGGQRLRTAERIFRSSGIFDSVAEEVRRGYRMEGRVKFTARRCGEPNAFYDPETVEVIFCYELVQDFLQMYVDELPEISRK
ncbi:DUF4344 domain-containing metallopeptidase [Devosia chinhatensis]|uniref:Metallopeptidase n=1 Tax=Devosia chinhatensis TaxID=429727 RepID=A0A0F5FLV6_9HYPH|nr:DUF4344 domain-containing metallopeptidase [Devosia chinhatensis]KKB09182.1 hypothetical protein VE26_04085 [Devosia chinhatensis]